MSTPDFMFLTDEQLVTQPVVTTTIPEWRTQITGRFSDISGSRVIPMFSSVFRGKRSIPPQKIVPVDSSGAVLYRWSK
jgi:hypothetical protein